MHETIAENAHHRVSCLILSRVKALQDTIRDDVGLTYSRHHEEIKELAKITAELAKADAAYQAVKVTQAAGGVTDSGLSAAAGVLKQGLVNLAEKDNGVYGGLRQVARAIFGAARIRKGDRPQDEDMGNAQL